MEPLANGFERAEVVVLGQELVGAGPLVWGQAADLQAVQQRLLVGGGRSQALPQAPGVKRRRAPVQSSGLTRFASPLWLPQRICAGQGQIPGNLYTDFANCRELGPTSGSQTAADSPLNDFAGTMEKETTNGHEAAPIEALLGRRILAHCLVNPGAAAVGPRNARLDSWGFVSLRG